MLVRSCFLITVIRCLKGQGLLGGSLMSKNKRWLSESVSHSVSDKVTYWAVGWQQKNYFQNVTINICKKMSTFKIVQNCWNWMWMRAEKWKMSIFEKIKELSETFTHLQVIRNKCTLGWQKDLSEDTCALCSSIKQCLAHLSVNSCSHSQLVKVWKCRRVN